MTKKIVIGALVMILGATFVFAGGNKEAANTATTNTQTADETQSKLLALIDGLDTGTYTGELAVTNRHFPELKVGNTVYRLFMFPMYAGSDLGIKDGDTVTVTAAKVTKELKDKFQNTLNFIPGRIGFGGNATEDVIAAGNYLLVVKIDANGKTYDLKAQIKEGNGCPAWDGEGPLMQKRMQGQRGKRGMRGMMGW